MSRPAAPFDPANDGVDHINVYSRGRTALGRFLSNFAASPFKVPGHGEFRSVEGYWFWLQMQGFPPMVQMALNSELEVLRTLAGYEAKRHGSELVKAAGVTPEDDDTFRDHIRAAITAKLTAYPEWLHQLKRNELPLEHYYVYGDKTVDVGYRWVLDLIEACKELPLPAHFTEAHPF